MVGMAIYLLFMVQYGVLALRCPPVRCGSLKSFSIFLFASARNFVLPATSANKGFE